MKREKSHKNSQSSDLSTETENSFVSAYSLGVAAPDIDNSATLVF